MPDTFIKIASVTVGSGGASGIDFTSIPSTYTDLVIKLSLRGTTASAVVGAAIAFNGSTSNFSYRLLYGTGSSALSLIASSGSFGDANASTSTASTFSNQEVYLPNYAGSNNKSFSVDAIQEDNTTTAYAELLAGLWSNTSAITSILIQPTSGNWAQHSTATLYGIKNS